MQAQLLSVKPFSELAILCIYKHTYTVVSTDPKYENDCSRATGPEETSRPFGSSLSPEKFPKGSRSANRHVTTV